MEMLDVSRQLQFDLDDLLWDARLCHYSSEQIFNDFAQLRDLYLKSDDHKALPDIISMLEDFQTKLDSGAVNSFVGNAA